MLQEALQHMERLRNGQTNDDDDANDAVQMDVFLLQLPSDRITHLQQLSQLADSFNTFIAKSDILWHVGYPPVFGVHPSDEKIPHLRAVCHYGANVGDEWMAIRIMMELSQQYPIAIHVWDLSVGPILLIEGSEALPDWIENEDSPNNHEYTCWIVNGTVTLIRPTQQHELTLPFALDCLRNSKMTSSPDKLQTEISKTIMNDSLRRHQRTALVLPRRVAQLFQRAPQLANAAAIAYSKSPSIADVTKYDDWVWTTCSLARTNYAMIRTLEPRETPKLTPELKRIQRICRNEATPHVRHALELGMRLSAGLEMIVSKTNKQNHDSISMSPTERRVLDYWTGIDVACGGNGMWLQQTWQSGPRNSPIDISFILKCPVFERENEFPYPLTHAGMTLSQVVKCELGKRENANDVKFSMPRPEHVDDEAWLYRGDEELEKAIDKFETTTTQPQHASSQSMPMEETLPQQQQHLLDDMIGGFQKFMSEESEVEGIASSSSQKRQRPPVDEPVEINPRVFLNLMQHVLKSSPEELARNLNGLSDDPFFSEEDYALMEPGVRINEVDSEDSSEEIETIMVRVVRSNVSISQ